MNTAVKNVACISALVLGAATQALGGTIGWVNGVYIPNDAAYQAHFGSSGDTVFSSALPESLQTPAEQTPAGEEIPTSPLLSPLSLTEDSLLQFVYDSMFAGLSQEAWAPIRANLAPQYASFAAWMQRGFGGATEVSPGDFGMALPPAPDAGFTTTGDTEDPSLSTDALGVMAATSLLTSYSDPLVDPNYTPSFAPLTLQSSGFTSNPSTFEAPVPEPSAGLLLLLGVSLLTASRWRRF